MKSSRVRKPAFGRCSHKVPHEQSRRTGAARVMNNVIGCGRARAAMPARALPSRGGEDRVRATVGWAATPKKLRRKIATRGGRQGRGGEKGGGEERWPPLELLARPPCHA